jgi:hypothetical protein
MSIVAILSATAAGRPAQFVLSRSENPLGLAADARPRGWRRAARHGPALQRACRERRPHHHSGIALRRQLRPLLDPAIRVVEVPGRQLRYAIPGLRRVIRAEAPAVVVSSEASLNLCVRRQADGNIAAAYDCRSELARRFEHSAVDRLLGSVNERFERAAPTEVAVDLSARNARYPPTQCMQPAESTQFPYG